MRLPAALAEFRNLPRQLWRMLQAICRRIRLQCKGEWPASPLTGGCCLNLTDATARPDPLIYSQPYLMTQGLAVTWDNPGIELYDDGVLVPSSDLKPNHEYEASATPPNVVRKPYADQSAAQCPVPAIRLTCTKEIWCR